MSNPITLENISCEYMDHMGDDLAVVNDARVSFRKISRKFSQSDERLLRYLARHNHWSPFAHSFIKFRITCPLFVAAQLFKHQVGLAANSVSRRYVSDEVTFWHTLSWREKAANKKQGSGDRLPVGVCTDATSMYINSLQVAFDTYNDLLALGVCEEQARAVLPTSTNTTFVWTGSLAAWLRVISLRCEESAQEETRQVAEMIAETVQRLFPVSYTAWKEFRGGHS